MGNSPTLYALLIGIDRYDPRGRVPHLRGCVRDAQEMERLLQERFAVPGEQIQTLVNEEATHDQIKAAFRTHLIGHAHRWAQEGRAEPPPAFLFHYSGHGSQAIDTTGHEPDGLDETLVAHDSRTPGIYDIKDWELGQLLEELNAFSDNVTVVLDCCHSGSGTRDVAQSEAPLARRCPPDLRPQPPEKQRPSTLVSKRTVTTGNWEIGGRHVLLAGCRDHEESNEYPIRVGGRRYWQGAMSHFLQNELRSLDDKRPQTYRELFERVQYEVNQIYQNQMPQCEGDIDREIFGGVRPLRDEFFRVVDQRDGLFWVNAGIAHGLHEGSEFTLYPPETRTHAEIGEPLAILTIVEEGSVESGCEVVGPGITIPLHGRCLIHRTHPGNMKRSVALNIDDPQLANALWQRLQPQVLRNLEGVSVHTDVSPWLKAIRADGDTITADLQVVNNHDALEIQEKSGTRLTAPFALDDLDGIAADLAHIARYQNALTLRNRAPSELSGELALSVKALAFDPATQEPIARDLPLLAGGEAVVEVGERVVFEITNHSDQPLYFALFDFSPQLERHPTLSQGKRGPRSTSPWQGLLLRPLS